MNEDTSRLVKGRDHSSHFGIPAFQRPEGLYYGNRRLVLRVIYLYIHPLTATPALKN